MRFKSAALLALVTGLPVVGASMLWSGSPRLALLQSSDGEAFVVHTATDTVAIERFTRTEGRLEGDLVDHGERDRRKTYVAILGADGLVSRFELAVRPANAARDTPPVQRARVTFRADGRVAEVSAESWNRDLVRGREPGTLPYLDLSAALLEQATVRAHALNRARVEMPLVDPADGRALTATIERLAGDSVSIRLEGLEVRALVDDAGRLLGGRIPSRGLTIDRVTVESAGLGRTDYSAPLDAPYEAQEVTVRATARHSLAGTLTLPADRSAPFPAVVLVTGSGAQDRDATYLGTYRPFRQMADALSRSGIAVLRLDDRGVGKSTGSFTQANSADFAEDVRAALVYLRQRPDIDAARLGLIGESEGGLIASMVAATDPDLRALVLMGTPSRTGRNIIESQVRYRLDTDATVPAAQRDSVLATIEARNESLARVLPWLRFILDYDPIPTAVQVSTPVLILHGDTDRQVTPNQAGELAVAFRAGGNHDVTVRIFPYLNHLFLNDEDGDPDKYPSLSSKAVPPTVLAEITGWTAEHLADARQLPNVSPPGTD